MTWLWIVLSAMFGGVVGMFGMAMMAVGGAADDYMDGYQDGRDEACEHVRAVEDLAKQRLRACVRYLGALVERKKTISGLQSENKLLRGMALGEGEDT